MIPAIHPYPAYKPSDVPWLGDVPAHWEVRRLRTIANVANGATPSTSVDSYWDGTILWVTPEDLGKLSSRYVVASGRRITEDGYQACGTTLAPAGSVAISTRAPIGHLGILAEAGCVNQGCRLLAPSAVQPEYLHYALATCRENLAVLGQGSTFTELSGTQLSDFRLPLPPLREQQAIVRYLDYVDRRIRRYVAAKRKLIALAGGGEAGHRQPGRHPRLGPQHSPQALRRRVARRRARALGSRKAEHIRREPNQRGMGK